MKIAVLTLAYNEEGTIGAVLRNWMGKADKHVVLHSDKPWHGPDALHDKTQEICEQYNAEFIRMKWTCEHEQRNWGLGYLYDYDYVFIVDADELFLENDIDYMINRVGQVRGMEDNNWCYRVYKIKTYFKSLDYVLDPPDTHAPVIAVNPKKILFNDCRLADTGCQIPLKCEMHHISYLRHPARLKTKFLNFEHFDQYKKEWFEKVWTNWTEEMEDVRAFGKEKSKAIFAPAPEEIKNLCKETLKII